MSLHNQEDHALSQMQREFKALVKQFLETNATHQRVQNYLDLANNNLDKLHTAICSANSNYKNYKLIKVSFRKEYLINNCQYEIELFFTNDRGERDSTSFGIDTFIIFLSRAGLVKDDE